MKIKGPNYKQLKQNIEEKFYDIGFGNDLQIDTKEQARQK